MSEDATLEALKQAEAAELSPEIAQSEPRTIGDALALAGPKPPDDTGETAPKIVYANRLSGFIARAIENAMRDRSEEFARIRAGEQEIGGGTLASKKIDVLLATPREGMKLNVSLKTQSFRDYNKKKHTVKATKAYCHNLTRIIDHELQIEAQKCHQLFPHAVVVALIAFPAAAWLDANPKKARTKRTDSDCSSAAEFAQRLRSFTGRESLRDADQEGRFEASFVAAHGIGEVRPDQNPYAFQEDVGFFEVRTGIPHSGLPRTLLTFDEFLSALAELYEERWHARRTWSD